MKNFEYRNREQLAKELKKVRSEKSNIVEKLLGRDGKSSAEKLLKTAKENPKFEKDRQAKIEVAKEEKEQKERELFITAMTDYLSRSGIVTKEIFSILPKNEEFNEQSIYFSDQAFGRTSGKNKKFNAGAGVERFGTTIGRLDWQGNRKPIEEWDEDSTHKSYNAVVAVSPDGRWGISSILLRYENRKDKKEEHEKNELGEVREITEVSPDGKRVTVGVNGGKKIEVFLNKILTPTQIEEVKKTALEIKKGREEYAKEAKIKEDERLKAKKEEERQKKISELEKSLGAK